VHPSFCALWQVPEKVNRRICGFYGKVRTVVCFREGILWKGL
jgi:hypothetical protein